MGRLTIRMMRPNHATRTAGVAAAAHRWRGRRSSDFCVFRQFQCVLNIDAQIMDRVLDIGVTQKNLHGAEIAGGLVDERGLGAPQRVRAILLLAKTDRGHPLINQSSILPGAQMIVRVSSAGNREVLNRTPLPLEPRQQTVLVSLVISNSTGRPVFCWITIARARMS